MRERSRPNRRRAQAASETRPGARHEGDQAIHNQAYSGGSSSPFGPMARFTKSATRATRPEHPPSSYAAPAGSEFARGRPPAGTRRDPTPPAISSQSYLFMPRRVIVSRLRPTHSYPGIPGRVIIAPVAGHRRRCHPGKQLGIPGRAGKSPWATTKGEYDPPSCRARRRAGDRSVQCAEWVSRFAAEGIGGRDGRVVATGASESGRGIIMRGTRIAR